METHLQHRDKVGVQDAVLLEDFTNDNAFIENLQKRFKENIIYTYIGQVLISVNPYKELDIYSPKDIKAYTNKHFFEVPPHVYAITDTAYRALKNENREQCILISGESGSGKTEASKKILQYIAEVTDHLGEVVEVKNKLLQSTPVLEAFGNAKTTRNDNSSRFGKYMDIQFGYEGNPSGGNILNYLLEKSRVINQVPGERNFHIFYQLILGASDEELRRLELVRDLKKYNYISNPTEENLAGVDDIKGYEEVIKALRIIGFEKEEQDLIYSIIAAILHLGNVRFEEVDGEAQIASEDLIQSISKLLGCDVAELTHALTHRTIETNLDTVTSPLNIELAHYARDALAKGIYERLFSWLVNRLNKSLESQETRQQDVIGILDIYGFEIFDRNSFEQLCINFCNEKLQQLFIELTLKSEQEEYLKEGIEWQNIEYFDNKIICDLIEEKHKGVIAYMDEECLRPGDASDLSMLAKFDLNLSAHKHFISHEKADLKRQKTMGRDEFCLIHYAGAVTYNVKGFLDKNNDLLFRDLREAMSNSSQDIVNSIFLKKEQESKKRPDTAITQFKNSLNNLMKILMNKEPSYIRCIKPNNEKQPGIFNFELVQHQVTYLGLMENLRVRRAGFAYRRQYELFLQRYKCLSRQTWPNYHGSAKDGVQILACTLGYEADEYKMGRTKIFIRYPKTLFETEDAFLAKQHDLAALIQAAWKGLVQRRRYLKMKEAAIVLQKYIRRHVAKATHRRRKNAAQIIRRFIHGFISRNDAPNDDNRSFIELAKAHWLQKLAKQLPKTVLDKNWPAAPHVCQEASEILKKLYFVHLARKYRLALTAEKKYQFELKVLAEKLFKGKKKGYVASVAAPFGSKDKSLEAVERGLYAAHLNGEKEHYATQVTKFDRHGYKRRERVLLVTNKNVYLVEAKSPPKLKHTLPLEALKFVITSENDKMLLVRIPEDMMKKNKGDLILEVPNLVEALTKIIEVTKREETLTIIDRSPIEHIMKQGKKGTIEFSSGSMHSIHKDKNNGHLVIIAT